MQFYEEPPYYGALERRIRDLAVRYPFLKVFSAGKSVLGRKLYVLGMGKIRSANLMTGAFHGQEWLTASLLLCFAEDLCRRVAAGETFCGNSLRERFAEQGILILPMVNPDGCEIALCGPESARQYRAKVEQMMAKDPRSWQANVRGVDLNHNFDAGFLRCKEAEEAQGILFPCASQYGGRTPHSEPETRALVNLCCGFDIRCAFAFHAQGEEIYYEYGPHTPLVSRCLASLLAESSGYRLAAPGGLASHGGFKDWFIEKRHRPGFTIEIGKGENPLPITELESIYRKLQEAMYIMATV